MWCNILNAQTFIHISLYMICLHYVFVVAYEPNQFHAQFRRNWHPWSHHHHLQNSTSFSFKAYAAFCATHAKLFSYCFFFFILYLGSFLIFHEKGNYYLSCGDLCGSCLVLPNYIYYTLKKKTIFPHRES